MEKKVEGIVLPEFKDKVAMIDVDRTLEVSAPDHTVNRHLNISIYAKKYKGIGQDILLCKGVVPL